jgi:hypothetical protein
MPTLKQLLILPVLLAMLLGCSKLTPENYGKIRPGLTYDAIIAILGKPDTCSGALFVKNCVWGNEQKNITVNFVGDKVLLYSSKNLK